MLGQKIIDYIESQIVISSLMNDDMFTDSRKNFGYMVLTHEFMYRNLMKIRVEHICYFDGTGGSLRLTSLKRVLNTSIFSLSQSDEVSPVKLINNKYLKKLDYSVTGPSIKFLIDVEEDEKNVLEILKELYEINGNGVFGSEASF
ncbi:hypothetical protein D3C76_03370 [compost metagenome]